MKNLYKSLLVVLLISSFAVLKGATAKKDVPIYTWNKLTNIMLTMKFSKSPIMEFSSGRILPLFTPSGEDFPRLLLPNQGVMHSISRSFIDLTKGFSNKFSVDIDTNLFSAKSVNEKIGQGKTLGQITKPEGNPVKLEFTVSKRGNISYTITGDKYSSIKDKKNSKEGIWHSSKGAIKITAVMTMKGLLKNKPEEFNITFSEPTVAEIQKSFK